MEKRCLFLSLGHVRKLKNLSVKIENIIKKILAELQLKIQ